MPSIINATTTNGVAVSGDNSGSLALQTNNGTTAVTIDTSQNVGIGTTSSVNGLSVYKYGTQWTGNTVNTYPVPAGNVYIQTNTISGQDNWIGTTGTYGTTTGSANLLLQANLNNTNQQAGNYIGSEATGSGAAALTFGRMIGGATTGSNATKSEAMRINSSGNLLIGTTTDNYGKLQIVQGASGGAAIFQNGSQNDLFQMYGNRGGSSGSAMYVVPMFFGDTTLRGGIYWNGSSIQYNTTSDYRLKENIAPMTGALAKVQALKPCTYTWKETGLNGQGFIAHELQELIPEAVTGEKDAIDANGNIIPQSVDTSNLVATLTAAIQELKAELDATKAEVQALKGA
jgi:hypothetical protein